MIFVLNILFVELLW